MTRRDILYESLVTRPDYPDSRGHKAYRSQKSVHKFIHLVRWHEITALQDPHRQVGDHHQVLSQHLSKNITKPVIVVKAADFGDHPEPFKCLII